MQRTPTSEAREDSPIGLLKRWLSQWSNDEETAEGMHENTNEVRLNACVSIVAATSCRKNVTLTLLLFRDATNSQKKHRGDENAQEANSSSGMLEKMAEVDLEAIYSKQVEAKEKLTAEHVVRIHRHAVSALKLCRKVILPIHRRVATSS